MPSGPDDCRHVFDGVWEDGRLVAVECVYCGREALDDLSEAIHELRMERLSRGEELGDGGTQLE